MVEDPVDAVEHHLGAGILGEPSPALSGSTPTIHTGSIRGERPSLMNRSVPMLPDPTIAARRLVVMG
jgi:hypothetical protein